MSIVLPGKTHYVKKTDSNIVVRVVEVASGTVHLRGVSGPVLSAKLDTHTFIRGYKKK